jgi:hypothetical protein
VLVGRRGDSTDKNDLLAKLVDGTRGRALEFAFKCKSTRDLIDGVWLNGSRWSWNELSRGLLVDSRLLLNDDISILVVCTEIYLSARFMRPKYKKFIYFSPPQNLPPYHRCHCSSRFDQTTERRYSAIMAHAIQQGDLLRLEISPKYSTIGVIPNGDEGNDANFPRNLHNAAELFLKLGMVPNAVKLKDGTDKLLEMYEGDPKLSVMLGQGCVCWSCGYCGIPKDYDESRTTPGPCFNCNETNQINWVSIKHPDGHSLPWIESSAMTEEQAKQMKLKEENELVERRAAVEAQIAAALKEREAAEKEST